MNSNKVSVSQNIQASQIRYFKLAVDTLILRMENNLADPKEDFHFKDEEHIIEKAEQLDDMYQNLTLSDEKKSELRQYILKEADIFNSKYREVYGDVYMDNYLNFVDCRDYDVFEAEKKENADQYKVIKPKVVDESDSESESEDDSDNSDSESSDSESESGDEQIEDDIYHMRGQIEEMKCRSRYDFPISGYGIDAKLIKIWRAIHISEAHRQAKDLSIKKEQAKLDKLIEANKQYKIKKSKEVIVDDSESESDDDSESEVSMFSETQSEDEDSDSDNEENELKKMKKIAIDLGSKVANLTRENEVKDLNIKRLEALREQDNYIINQYIQNADKSSKTINGLEDKVKELRFLVECLKSERVMKDDQIIQS